MAKALWFTTSFSSGNAWNLQAALIWLHRAWLIPEWSKTAFLPDTRIERDDETRADLSASPLAEAFDGKYKKMPPDVEIDTSDRQETSISGVFSCGDAACSQYAVTPAIAEEAWAEL